MVAICVKMLVIKIVASSRLGLSKSLAINLCEDFGLFLKLVRSSSEKEKKTASAPEISADSSSSTSMRDVYKTKEVLKTEVKSTQPERGSPVSKWLCKVVAVSETIG